MTVTESLIKSLIEESTGGTITSIKIEPNALNPCEQIIVIKLEEGRR